MGRHVLLIEDSRSQALRFQRELQRRGFHVDIARRGRQGLDLAARRRPDAIILDIELPDLNGFEVCRQLKQDPDTTWIPIVMLTSRSSAEATLTGLQAGAVDFIPKDMFAESRLLELLQELR